MLLACRQWDPLGLARRLPSLGVGAWRCAPLLPWRVQCPVGVCAALAGGSGGLGRYLVLCLSRFPLPAPRVPRCVWRAVLSGCPLPSLAGAPFHAVCAFRALGPVALLVVPACPLRVCALALPRRSLPPPWVVWRAHPAWSWHWALVGPLRVSCPGPLLRLACLGGGGPVPVPLYLAWGCGAGGRAPPGGGAFYCCEGCLGSGAPPPPTARPLGGLLRSAIHVLWARACGCGGPSLSPRPARPVGAARHGAGPWRSCAGGRLGGGGVRRTPRLCGRGGACRAGGRSASFRPSAFPGQATKRVSLASCCPWGAWPPIPLRFVLTRLLWARSVRRPGALARARLFSAAPVGAGGWGWGAGRAPAALSGGGGTIPPASGGGGRGPRSLRAVWGGGGGGSRRGIPAPLLGGGLRYSILAPVVPSAHSLLACACGRGRSAAPGWGGVRGGPWTALLGAIADLNPPSEWAVVTGGSCGARPPYCFDARVAPARWCGLTPQPRLPQEQVQPHPPPPASRSLLGGGGSPLGTGGAEDRSCGSLAGGPAGGGGGGLPPRRASACLPLPPACPPGIYSCRGGCRAAAGAYGSVRQGGQGEGRGTPPP